MMLLQTSSLHISGQKYPAIGGLDRVYTIIRDINALYFLISFQNFLENSLCTAIVSKSSPAAKVTCASTKDKGGFGLSYTSLSWNKRNSHIITIVLRHLSSFLNDRETVTETEISTCPFGHTENTALTAVPKLFTEQKLHFYPTVILPIFHQLSKDIIPTIHWQCFPTSVTFEVNKMPTSRIRILLQVIPVLPTHHPRNRILARILGLVLFHRTRMMWLTVLNECTIIDHITAATIAIATAALKTRTTEEWLWWCHHRDARLAATLLGTSSVGERGLWVVERVVVPTILYRNIYWQMDMQKATKYKLLLWLDGDHPIRCLQRFPRLIDYDFLQKSYACQSILPPNPNPRQTRARFNQSLIWTEFSMTMHRRRDRANLQPEPLFPIRGGKIGAATILSVALPIPTTLNPLTESLQPKTFLRRGLVRPPNQSLRRAINIALCQGLSSGSFSCLFLERFCWPNELFHRLREIAISMICSMHPTRVVYEEIKFSAGLWNLEKLKVRITAAMTKRRSQARRRRSLIRIQRKTRSHHCLESLSIAKTVDWKWKVRPREEQQCCLTDYRFIFHLPYQLNWEQNLKVSTEICTTFPSSPVIRRKMIPTLEPSCWILQ